MSSRLVGRLRAWPFAASLAISCSVTTAVTAAGANAADAVAPVTSGELQGSREHGQPQKIASPGDVRELREVVVPVPGAERLRIHNPLGSVTVRSWDRRDKVHVVAQKRGPSAEAVQRLRVHYTAWTGGEITLDARFELGGRDRALPLSGSRIDLVVDVPADLEVEAKTFGGDITATGLGAGARLETTTGRIHIADVRGHVVTRQLRGGQLVRAVDGDVDVDGVEGLLELERLAGQRVEARMVDGDIRADDVRAEIVRLASTTGTVALVGVLLPGARYDLRSYSGEIRVAVAGAPGGVDLRARGVTPTVSKLPVSILTRHGDRIEGEARPFGRPALALASTSRAARPDGSDRRRAVVEVSSVLGRVVLEALPDCSSELCGR